MVSYRKKAHKTHKNRRSKKGGDDTKKNIWDIEMGSREESPEYVHAAKRADDMERGHKSPHQETIYEKELKDISKRDDKMERGMKLGGKRRRGNKSKKHYKKGTMSKTRKGRKNFVTHKGDNDFHRRGRRQTKRQGKKSKSLLSRIFGL
jgi:hypothetical protein